MNRIAVLITCFNRKDRTLRCLQTVSRQNIAVDIFLVDDGCTDGTPEAVSLHFPDVHIIKGDGNLYWNRGMYTAWSEAEKGDYDFYLWLNDDTYLYNDALKMTLEASSLQQHKALIVGAICSLTDKTKSFGGDYMKKQLYPNGELQLCDAFGGNFVWVPRSVFQVCGKMDPYYRHSLGDTDYGLVVAKKGFKMFLTPKHVGEFDDDFELPNLPWLDSSKPLKERYKMLYHPLSYSNPKEFFHFYRKHQNFFVALIHVCSIYRNIFNVKAINKYK